MKKGQCEHFTMKRPSSPSNEKTTKLQIVPWFNKNEWQETYQQAYSSDIKLQEKAYTQMCMWKARFPNIPLGVECTMSTLHVKLCDTESDSSTDTSSTYKDRDLQLLYSTAVMRFLNQLTVLSDRKDSMYKVAEQHQLPDWIINLRHEAAHGNSVPSLYLLRQAADVILQWLKDNYWEAEAHVMEDVVKKPEQEKERVICKIRNLLDLWVTLKVHFWSKIGTINRIDDKHIRDQAMELAGEEGCGIKLAKDVAVIKKSKGNDSSDIDMEGEVGEIHNNEENQEEYTHKIKTAFEPLLRRLFEPLKSKSYKKLLYQNCLIDCLSHHPCFCPPVEVEHLEEPEVQEMMSLMGDLWKEIVELLQAHGLLHCLLQQLMRQEDQLTFSQLWLKLVTQLMTSQAPPMPPGTVKMANMLAQHLPCAVTSEILVERVNLYHMKIQKPIDLKPASAEEVEALQQLGRKVVGAPTKFTIQYLPSLLSIWEPRLSWEAREKLFVLAGIYNGRQPLRNLPTQVYTSASLGLDTEGEREGKVEGAHTEQTQNLSSAWTLYSGDADWSHCALGALPW